MPEKKIILDGMDLSEVQTEPREEFIRLWEEGKKLPPSESSLMFMHHRSPEEMGNEKWVEVYRTKDGSNQNIIIWDTGGTFYTEYLKQGKRVRLVRTGQEDDIAYLEKFLTKIQKPEE